MNRYGNLKSLKEIAKEIQEKVSQIEKISRS